MMEKALPRNVVAMVINVGGRAIKSGHEVTVMVVPVAQEGKRDKQTCWRKRANTWVPVVVVGWWTVDTQQEQTKPDPLPLFNEQPGELPERQQAEQTQQEPGQPLPSDPYRILGGAALREQHSREADRQGLLRCRAILINRHLVCSFLRTGIPWETSSSSKNSNGGEN